ncbi:MAG TPA: hypothetical protein VE197_12640 [Mycobacterium sp.]|nr:hypothetical protein [Mycobacterium sp.]
MTGPACVSKRVPNGMIHSMVRMRDPVPEAASPPAEPERVGGVEGVVAGEGVGLAGLGDLGVDGEELGGGGVVVAVD